MHYLVIAKTKDYPFVSQVIEALTYYYNGEITIGKWDKMYENRDEFIAINKDRIEKVMEKEGLNFDDAVYSFMRTCLLEYSDYGAIFEKTSCHFDYCDFGGGFIENGLPPITEYKNIQKYGHLFGFVTENYEFHCTDNEKCTFEDDELVYIIDCHG